MTLEQAATDDSILTFDGSSITMSRGFNASYTSDGKRWREGPGEHQPLSRKPQAFGVPATTLVGYYDPQEEFVSFISPALHGAYGFAYGDDRERVTDHDWWLVVETREGPLRFGLANQRLNSSVMNKFHVNVPESSQPTSVAVVCQGKVVEKRVITGVTEQLAFTTHGDH